ncbi:MAG: transporter substrate-binding domain-containing protein [Synergistaceae bacterium]|nr:transporter substrate-binding domain-containing protein [Synergistaceae bacterium]
MKKYIVIFVLVICVSVFVFMRGDEDGSKSKPVLRVGVECDYPPNNWEEKRPTDFNVPLSNQEGSYADGYDIQIAKFVANELDMTLSLKKIQWNDLLPALNKGEIDAIFSGMLDTAERRNSVAFSETYEVKKTEYAIIVNNSSPYAKSKTFIDFRGAKIIAQKGTKLDAVIDQIPGVIHVKPTETVQQMLDALVNYRVDGAVINVDTGHSYEATYKNLTLKRFPEGKGFVLNFSGICAGVRKSDTELLHRINRTLDGLEGSKRQKIMESTVSRLLKSAS